MKYICITILGLLLAFGCASNQERTLFNNNTCIDDNEQSIPLSELISDSVRLIPLETNDTILIGRVNKIKKFDGDYFVMADDRQVLHFNEKGKYIASLNKKGEGPEEYASIIDFDVYKTNEGAEIWIAAHAKIKCYNAVDLSFKRDISFPFFVNKFRRVDNETLLIMCGKGENSLFITDMKGVVKSEFLPSEFPYLMLRPVQFRKYQDSLSLFQLGVSNDYVSYNSKSCMFDYGGFFAAKNQLLTKDVLKEMYEKDGIDYLGKLNQSNYIKSFAPFGKAMCFNIFYNGAMYFSKVEKGGETRSVNLKATAGVNNDLFDLSDSSFLLTLGFTESDGSLLFFTHPSSFCDGTTTLTMRDKTTIQITEEDNPLLIEFFQ